MQMVPLHLVQHHLPQQLRDLPRQPWMLPQEGFNLLPLPAMLHLQESLLAPTECLTFVGPWQRVVLEQLMGRPQYVLA